MSVYFKNSEINEPYYYRQYEHDLQQVEEENLAKRLTLVSLPFFALHAPFAKVISLTMNTARSFSTMSNLSGAYQNGNYQEIGSAGLQVALAVISLSTVFVFHPISLMITTGHDIALNTKDSFEFLRAGDYSHSLSSMGQLANSGIYFAMLATNSLALVVLSLSVQIALEGYRSMDEFKEGRNLEGWGHFFMSIVRIAQLQPQIKLLQLEKSIKKEISPEKKHDESFEEYIEEVETAICTSDWKAFQHLKQSENWAKLSTSDLENLNYTLFEGCFKENLPRKNAIGLKMLEAILLDHPNANKSLEELTHLLDDAAAMGNADVFEFLLKRHPEAIRISSKQLLGILDYLCHVSLYPNGDITGFEDRLADGKAAISQMIVRHANWDKNSPQFLQEAYCCIINGILRKNVQIQLFQEFSTYPSWNQLDEKGISKILLETSYLRDSEIAKYVFHSLQKHNAYEKIDTKTLETIACRMVRIDVEPGEMEFGLDKIHLLELVTKHPHWKNLTPKQISTIAESIAWTGEYEYELLYILSKHENWKKIRELQLVSLADKFMSYMTNVKTFRLFVDHPNWEKIDTKHLAELAVISANRDCIDMLHFIAKHPNWQYFSAEDLVKIIKESYQNSHFMDIIAILSNHTNWNSVDAPQLIDKY